MAKIQAAQARLYKNMFVCKKCGSKQRSEPRKIIEKKVKCRKCRAKAFRPAKSKK
ncbi:MAG: hypothetical protein ABIH72_03525 [archaeon]